MKQRHSTQSSILSPHHSLLRVRVTPRAGRDALAGWRDGVLLVRLAAPPAEGRANAALTRFLARAAGLPPGRVRLISGERAREKRVAFDGIDDATLRERLAVPPAQTGDTPNGGRYAG